MNCRSPIRLVRTDWREQAACAGADPAPFDVPDGRARQNMPPETRLAAIRFCLPCVSRAECSRDADENQLTGLHGGGWRSQIGRRYLVADLLDRPWIKARDAA